LFILTVTVTVQLHYTTQQYRLGVSIKYLELLYIAAQFRIITVTVVITATYIITVHYSYN